MIKKISTVIIASIMVFVMVLFFVNSKKSFRPETMSDIEVDRLFETGQSYTVVDIKTGKILLQKS